MDSWAWISLATVKVNIGSGTTVADGWINYDRSIYFQLAKYRSLRKLLYKFNLIDKRTYELPSIAKSIVRRDVRRGLPLKSESVEFIYCSHFLEHIRHEEAIKVLKECHRVLKKGGWIRVVCPDLVLSRQVFERGFRLFWSTQEKRTFPSVHKKPYGHRRQKHGETISVRHNQLRHSPTPVHVWL